ncbi:MAG TPA: EAL domain-containing protein [Chthonomonadaceae bacterium]|nr:EAL domain-containing protein [Chthonomonadaceae bacterium]
MFAYRPLTLFDASSAVPCPVPAAYAESVERLIEAFRPGSMAFLLQVQQAHCPDWLTGDRILSHVGQALLEPMQPQVWPLLEGVWVVAVSVEGGVEGPVSALQAHALRKALADRLEADWREHTPDIRADVAGPEGETVPDLPPFTLTPVAAMPCTEDLRENIEELNSLLEIILQKQLRAQFQPIVNLRDGRIFGYEALIRGPKGALLQRSGALFRAADKARLISWLDLACQEQCFASAAEQRIRHLLFINMDAEGLSFLDLQGRPLALRAREYGLAPENIVIEITERQTVSDFPRLLNYIGRLREEGFKIAVDDAGAGYSSLYTISELRPEFVKVGRAVVRNIDVNGERRSLLAALAQYARTIGAAMLAEGPETRQELATLIDLGIPYSQGYLMGKPADSFRGVPRETREFIHQRAQQSALMAAGRSVTIGRLARRGMAMPPETPLAEAARYFAKDASLTSVVVVEEGRPRGLVMRQQLDYVLDVAKAANIAALLPAETLAQWMRTSVLFADAEASLHEIARQATTRADISLESDVIIVQGGNLYAGVLPIRALMEAVTAMRR